MKSTIRQSVALFVLCATISAAATPGCFCADIPAAFAPAQSLPEMDARFQNRAPWIGGDGAYTVALNAQTTLWLFSDTFIGEIRDNKRANAKMVNNTVAVQKGHGAETKFDFAVRRDAGGKPAALFAPVDGKGWYWILASLSAQEKLYMTFARIEKTGEKGAFAFKHFGQTLGVVKNPNDPPASWHVEEIPLPCTEFTKERSLAFGSAALIDKGFAYIYGIDEQRPGAFSSKKMIVARVSTDKIDDVGAWRFFKDGEWQNDYKSSSALADGVATEFSVSYLAKAGKYFLVYTERGMSPKIFARSAPNPWGPWSAPEKIFECPEAAWDKRIFCYAAKSHPELTTADDELIVSYVANSHDFWHVFSDARLYFPRFFRVKLAH